VSGNARAAFHARYLELIAAPPSPYPRLLLYVLAAALIAVAAGVVFGRIDVVAVAPGKLVPQSFLKVVQPTDSGVVRDILVREGQSVQAGQVLFRMDAKLSEADLRILETELALRRLQLRRIAAELGAGQLERAQDERVDLYVQVEAQFNARRRAFNDALEAERSALAKGREDLRAAEEVEAKLKRTAPIFREQEKAWEQLANEGYAGKLLALERRRNRIENEQDLHAQAAAVSSAHATIALAERRIAQLGSNYQRELNNERIEVRAQLERLQEDLAKQAHRSGQLELRAPTEGIVKDLATHSAGTVVAPGTILATIVPATDPMEAEVWIGSLDAGRVAVGARVQLKLAAYPFQRFGMMQGLVRHVSADATERPDSAAPGSVALYYRALISIDAGPDGRINPPGRLASGMQLAAEIHLGTRTVLDYLLSPVRKTLGEAAREL